MNLPEIIMERVKVGLELKNIVKQDLPLDTWWEPANEENPRLAYERFLDTTRLAVELAYTTEGDAIGLYAAKANGDSRLAFKFLVDFLQQAKRQRRMPRWWTPQHDVCLFRLAFDEKGDFYLYHAVEVSDVRKTWGYRTTKLLLALATTIDGEDGVPEGRFDDTLRIACDLYLDETPQREKGYENGEGIPCRWGVKCKRPDCWFQHPKLVLGEETKRSGQPQYSSTNMKDHMLELVGDELELETLYLLYHQSLGIGESIFYHVSPAEQAEAQRKLKESASKGDSFAMYLLGKIWKELKVPMFGKQKAAKSRRSEACKLWTASALAGNAYAMTGLALLHRDAGHMPTAVHWWQRALEHAEFPEAAYDLGVAYGLNETVGADAVPINYEQAAMYYAIVADMDLQYMGVDLSSPDDKHVRLGLKILHESPSKNEQLGFQKLAKANLRTMERFLGNPSAAPLENNKELPPFVEDEQTLNQCLLCQRRSRVGEENMMICTKCDSAPYCNSICQLGHWAAHKPECRTASY